MKTRPLILRDDEVRDIRAGRKTQLRRIVKRAVDRAGESACAIYPASESGWILWFGLPLNTEKMAEFTRKRYKHGVPCPFGRPGDRLWVKEAWGDRAAYATIGRLRSDRFYYRAGDIRSGWKCRNAANMPRVASRMTLEVVNVRPERLQSISDDDCRAEGCEPDWDAFENATAGVEGWEEPEDFVEECEEEGDWVNCGRELVHSREHQQWQRDRTNYASRLAFRKRWESIHGPRSWDANHWVWVCDFKWLEGEKGASA